MSKAIGSIVVVLLLAMFVMFGGGNRLCNELGYLEAIPLQLGELRIRRPQHQLNWAKPLFPEVGLALS
jgi:hypothetical protein